MPIYYPLKALAAHADAEELPVGFESILLGVRYVGVYVKNANVVPGVSRET